MILVEPKPPLIITSMLSSAVMEELARVEEPDRKLLLHPGQLQVYRSRARFKVVVAGRRWGKCLCTGSMISMANGAELPVEQVKPGDTVLTVNEDTYELEPRVVQHVHDNGVRETVVVSTASRSLRCTPNHPLLVNNRWVDAGEIKPGDLVAVPKHLAFGDASIPDHELVLLTLWLAEGHGYRITNKTPQIVDELFKASAAIGLTPVSADGLNWGLFNGDRTGGPQAGTKNPLRKLLESHGLWGLNSKTKFIPDVIFRLGEEQVARFLNLFVACDGSISRRSKSTWSIEVGLANEALVTQIARLLHKFGIRGQIRFKRHKAKSSRTGDHFESWALVVSDSKAIQIFAARIGAASKEKQVAAAAADAAASLGNSNAYLPISHDDFVKHLDYSPVARGKFGGYNCAVSRDLPEELRVGLNSWRKQNASRVSQRRYEALRGFSDGFFDPIADGDVAWEEVKSVEKAEKSQTWDLTVEGNHNFIAEGIVTHNTQLSKTTMVFKARKPKQRIWYIAPTYRMAKQIIWDDLLEAIPSQWIKKVNETTMTVRLINGSIIECKGADKPDTLRGVGLHYVVLDEFQDMKWEVWQEAVRPTLASTGGHALFIGTPKSFNHLYDLYTLGQQPEYIVSGQWESWQFPTITSPFIPESEIVQARRDMDAKSFKQEFEASFETMSGRVYYPFDRGLHVGKLEFNPQLPIWVGQDFNIDPMSSIIMQPQRNGEVWVIDEIILYGSNTEETCDELERRFWRYQKGTTVYPDPAGGHRQHARGESDLDIFRERGFRRMKYHRQHPKVKDRVNAVNRMLMSADGRVRLRVDEKCKETISSFEQTIYKEGSPEVDKSQSVEHATDALGYCIEYEYPARLTNIRGLSI